jgi:glycosyltransferase involved in cell wall biosynthesis
MSVFDCPEGFNARFAAWYQFLLPRLARRARRVITDSEFIKERILKHTKVDAEKVVVIYLGVDNRFCPEAISRIEETIATLKLPSRRYVLAVGSLEPRKNLARLFQAWALVEKRMPDVWLVVAGASGSARVFSEGEFAAVPPRVFFAGQVSDELLPALNAGATAMAYPSIYEGFGLPPLEAMASGTAVLVGNRASLPEVVGDAGLLVDPLDVKAIGDGLRRLVQDVALREDLRHKGLLRAKKFSWDETARRTWNVLQTAAT